MTRKEKEIATLRLKELERGRVLPEETLRDLRKWWREKLVESGGKIVSFDTRLQKKYAFCNA